MNPDDVSVAQQAMSPAAAGPPNILYVHIDNLGMGELGCYGEGSCAARTPRDWTASPTRVCSCSISRPRPSAPRPARPC